MQQSLRYEEQPGYRILQGLLLLRLCMSLNHAVRHEVFQQQRLVQQLRYQQHLLLLRLLQGQSVNRSVQLANLGVQPSG